jgi:arylsulfatase
MAVYAAQVYRMDAEIGRILHVLRKEEILDNTLIWFLSDNGATQAAIYLASGWYADRTGPIGSATSFDAYGARWANASNTPFKLFKHWTAEGGIATPLIVYWPEMIKPILDKNHYGHVIDILPTCLETAGIPQNYLPGYEERKELEGQSLLPLFEGKEVDHERPLFWEHQGNWAVRKGAWKLLFTREINGKIVDKLELFNLNADRSECRDISGENTGKVSELKELYARWAQKVGVEPWDSLILAKNL